MAILRCGSATIPDSNFEKRLNEEFEQLERECQDVPGDWMPDTEETRDARFAAEPLADWECDVLEQDAMETYGPEGMAEWYEALPESRRRQIQERASVNGAQVYVDVLRSQTSDPALLRAADREARRQQLLNDPETYFADARENALAQVKSPVRRRWPWRKRR